MRLNKLRECPKCSEAFAKALDHWSNCFSDGTVDDNFAEEIAELLSDQALAFSKSATPVDTAPYQHRMPIMEMKEALPENQKTYEIFVRGVTARHVIVEAENQEAAEIEAKREFSLLVGAFVDSDELEIVKVEELTDTAPSPELLGSLSDLI
jgi:hypothetical protein